MASGPIGRRGWPASRGLQFGQGATQSIKSWEEKEEEGKKSESRWRRGWGTRRTDVKSRFYNRDNPMNGGKAGDRGGRERDKCRSDSDRDRIDIIRSGPVCPAGMWAPRRLGSTCGHNELGHCGVGRRRGEDYKTLTHFRSFGRRASQLGSTSRVEN